MAATVNVNGRISPEHEAVISVFDHGFLYGEGIYETLRTYNGRLFLYDRHMRRMRNSARLIDLDLPFTDAELATRIQETIDAAKLEGAEAYVRVLVTRGVGELTYDLKATPKPSWVIIVKPLPLPFADVYEKGVKVVLVDIVRNHPQSVNPMIKSNNLMNSALAAQQAIKRGGFEAVMRNYRGELTECTQSNLFIVKDGVTLTPPLEAGLLPGITREFVFEIGRDAGVEVREQMLRDIDLLAADEAFLTSTTREVLPIVAVDDRNIGDGKPGPVTLQLLNAFRDRTWSASMTAGLDRMDWDEHYKTGDAFWDKGTAAPGLAEYLARYPVRGRTLVPGCGRGHEVAMAVEHGLDALGLDVAPTGIAQARALYPQIADRFMIGNFFDMPAELRGAFEVVLEHTLLSALPPAMRTDYRRAVDSILRPGGLLIGVWFINPSLDPGEEGPPFGISPAELTALFQDGYEIVADYVPNVAFPNREGRERLRVLRRLEQ